MLKAIFSAFHQETYRLPPFIKRSANTIANLMEILKLQQILVIVLGGSVGLANGLSRIGSSCYGTTTISGHKLPVYQLTIIMMLDYGAQPLWS